MTSILNVELNRKTLEQIANYIYYALCVGNGIVMFALVWRVDNLVMRIWAVLAAFAIIGSSIIWLKATQYSFQGSQVYTARIFLALDWLIAVANILALFYAELAPQEAQTAAYGLIHFWSIAGSAIGVISAFVGIGFLIMFSPDRLEADVSRQYKYGMFKVLHDAMKTGDLPEDIKRQQMADAYDTLRNIVHGVGGNTVNGSNISPTGGERRSSVWDILKNTNHTTPLAPPTPQETQNTQPPTAIPFVTPAAWDAKLLGFGYSAEQLRTMTPLQKKLAISEFEMLVPSENGAKLPNA